MQLSNIPGKLVLPFANAGGKSTIPVASQIGITAGAASLTDGFPPLTRTPVAAGGVPPSGLDMNGILYEMSAIIRWANAGGGYPFDGTFATDTNVGGYPKGARIMRTDGTGYWFNTVENNVTDPEGAGAAAAGWVPDFTSGSAAVTMTSANITLTPSQYGKPLIVIIGTLTGNLNLILPSIVGQWVVINNTGGGYSVTAKTASGTGVTLGTISQIIGDGTNIYAANPDSVQIVANIATLRNIAPTLSRRMQTKGYYTIGDGGSGQYFGRIGATPGTYVDDGGSVIVPNGGNGSSAWFLDINGPVSVKQFGAYGDDSHNDTGYFNNTIAYSATSGRPIYAPEGIYLLDDLVFTDGPPVGNGNKYGHGLFGDGIGKTILKCSGASDTFLAYLGDPGNYFYTYFKTENLTVDMQLMPNASTSVGIYGIYAYGGSVNDISVINQPSSAFSLYLDQGCYTTMWQNCDFGGLTGRVKLQGVGSQSVTTQIFSGCSFAQLIADNCSSNSVSACIVQGDLTPKFQLSEQYGMTISGNDIEGTGVLYNFGGNCNQITSMGNALVGFSGTYSIGTIASGMLMDQIYPVTVSGNPFKIKNQAITPSAAASGFTVAQEINGTITEKVVHPGITRKLVCNTSSDAQTVDVEYRSINGSTYVGRNPAGESYIEGTPGEITAIKTAGVNRVGVDQNNKLLLGTDTRYSVGAAGAAAPLPALPAAYLEVNLGGLVYAIPFYSI